MTSRKTVARVRLPRLTEPWKRAVARRIAKRNGGRRERIEPLGKPPANTASNDRIGPERCVRAVILRASEQHDEACRTSVQALVDRRPRQVVEHSNRRHNQTPFVRVSKASRKPSARRFTASTVIASAMPGIVMMCGARRK
jgi:hypothetical protein